MQIRELTYHLTQALFDGRAFLPVEAFEPLHEFKHLCQDIIVELDRLTRPGTVDDKQAYQAAIPGLEEEVSRVRELYPSIESMLTLRMGEEWIDARS